METVEASAVKTNLEQLLNRVERGESVIITRRGKPIAQLVPTSTAVNLAHAETFRNIADVGATRDPEVMSVRDMINEGRRF